jgi:trk system potassium uptake protein TrkH
VQQQRLHLQPLLIPIVFFGLAIFLGSVVLVLPVCLSEGKSLHWIDALFTAASATCVTGLAVVDTGTTFSRSGQVVLLFLMQVGGLGIMSLTSLGLYLLRKRVTLTDRIAVGQNLLQDPSFHLGRFLYRLVVYTFVIELVGAVLLHVVTRGEMGAFSTLFHAVSAFCNGGFSLYADSLSRWVDAPLVNLVVAGLIILGGIGFFVMTDVMQWLGPRLAGERRLPRSRLSWYSEVVLKNTLFLIVAGTVAIFVAEWVVHSHHYSPARALLASFFQAVSCRTAGFNTVPVGGLGTVTLLVMIALMFIGAAPGSCAGGIKITTFRVLVAFLHAELRGRDQTVIGRMAVSREAVRRSMSLFAFSVLIICLAILVLCYTETGTLPDLQARARFIDITFEVVSAFGTAGLSTGLTPELTLTGKYVIIALMFIGRLGPLVFIGALSTLQRREAFSRPDADLLIG